MMRSMQCVKKNALFTILFNATVCIHYMVRKAADKFCKISKRPKVLCVISSPSAHYYYHYYYYYYYYYVNLVIALTLNLILLLKVNNIKKYLSQRLLQRDLADLL